MPKKHTLDEVRKICNSRSVKMLNDEYVNISTPLLVRCPADKHDWLVSLASLRKGADCLQCQGRNSDRGHTMNRSYIEEFLKRIDWEVLGEYKSANTPLLLRCPNGHETTQTWHKIKNQGPTCRFCSIESGKYKGKYTEEEVRAILKRDGSTLISPYKNTKTKITFLCPNQHEHSMEFRAYLAGQRCPHCRGIIRFTAENIQEFLDEFECKLLSISASKEQTLKIQCSKKHVYERTWVHIKEYPQCPYCSGSRVSDAVINEFLLKHDLFLSGSYTKPGKSFEITCNRSGHVFDRTWDYVQEYPYCPYCEGTIVTTEFVQKQLNPTGFLLESEYVCSTQKIRIRCDNNHVFDRSWGVFQLYPHCPYCKGYRMTEEDKEIAKLKGRLAEQFREQFMRLVKAGEKLPGSSKSAIVNELIPEIYELLGSPPPVDPKDPDKWVIDHVVPIRFFDLRNLDEVKACWRGHNLRWLKRSPNSSRQHRLTMQEVCLFTPEQLDILRIASRKPQKWKDYLSNLKQKQDNPHQLTLDLLRVAGLSIAS